MDAKEGKMIQRITQIIVELEDFCHSQNNMFFPIREA